MAPPPTVRQDRVDILVEDCRVEGRGPGSISQHGLHIGSDGGGQLYERPGWQDRVPPRDG